ncbi:MAG: hypothetical protein HKN16_12675 [Saprospiraceae bacterium]|nr:hypothetical protein [Saprospiraceae bacterium]
MKKFLIHTSLFLVVTTLTILGGTLLLSQWVENRGFLWENCESNLLPEIEEQNADVLFLGNSHARNFSRGGNHEKVESAFEKKIINLGQGRGICGPNDQHFYLQYAINSNLTFDKVVYVISPPFLYGEHLDSSTNTFFEEPLRLDFFWSYLSYSAPNKAKRLFHYLRTKWRPLWLGLEPKLDKRVHQSLVALDQEEVDAGFGLAYPNGLKEESFQSGIEKIERSISFAKDHGAEVLVIVTPTLFGDWPGQERLDQWGADQNSEGVVYRNFSSAISSPEMFYDHHHLNQKGILAFCEILRPFFND